MGDSRGLAVRCSAEQAYTVGSPPLCGTTYDSQMTGAKEEATSQINSKSETTQNTLPSTARVRAARALVVKMSLGHNRRLASEQWQCFTVGHRQESWKLTTTLPVLLPPPPLLIYDPLRTRQTHQGQRLQAPDSGGSCLGSCTVTGQSRSTYKCVEAYKPMLTWLTQLGGNFKGCSL